MLLGGHDAGDVFLQLVVVFLIDQALATFDCKHDLDIDLGISVGHVQMMPLLTELENPPLVRVYKDDAPDGAVAPPALSLALRGELRGSGIGSTFGSQANRGKMSKLQSESQRRVLRNS